MSKHTPGPWRFTEIDSPSGGKQHAIVGIPFGDVVAVTSYPFHGREAMEANARLIAAAPDLLEALQWALEQIEPDLDLDHQDAMTLARIAVAQATGTQP